MKALSPTTLRRRSNELSKAGERETQSEDLDTAALIKFYAAECGLKSVYMENHGLKNTEEERGGKNSARSFGHHLQKLVEELNIPPREVPPPPHVKARRGDVRIHDHQTHECWRYGEKLVGTEEFSVWLDIVIKWVEKQR